MSAAIVHGLPRDWIPRLSEHLALGFSAVETGSANFHSPAILEWKYFYDQHRARSVILSRDNRIITHIGRVFTEFQSTDLNFKSIPALHMIDWISRPDAGPAASALLIDALKQADIQYALGSTEPARHVLLGFKYREVMRVPRFHSVLKPFNSTVWPLIYGVQSPARRAALFALDFAQNLRKRFISGALKLREATQFGAEIESIFKSPLPPFLFTARTPLILNHLLAHPHKVIAGWHILEGQSLRGFALTSCFSKGGGTCIGKIVDCFIDSSDPLLWANAFSLLRDNLAMQGADLVGCYGSLPWIENALRHAGFFRRGRVPFYLRDPKNLIPPGAAFHLTHIEGDAAIL